MNVVNVGNAALSLESPFGYTSWKKYARKQVEYVNEVVIPTLQSGDWSLINKLPILMDENGNVLIRFSDNEWLFKRYLQKSHLNDTTLANLYFYLHDESKTGEKIELPEGIRQELKAFALHELFIRRTPVSKLTSLYRTITSLKFLGYQLAEFGLKSYSHISLSKLNEMIECGFVELQQKTLHSLNQFSKAALPIKFGDIGKFVFANIPAARELRDYEQHCVVPLAIYKSLIDQTEAVIEKYHPVRLELAGQLRKAQRLQLDAKKRIILSIRSADSVAKLGSYFNKKEVERIECAFADSGIRLYDNFSEGDKWLGLFHELDPSFKSFNIKGQSTLRRTTECYDLATSLEQYKNLSSFKNVLSEVDAACRFIIQAFSGMRTDEMYRMHPTYGLQSTVIKGQKIYLLTTRQSKIKRGVNTIDDVYVTTSMGAKAYQLLNAIHEPLREQFVVNKHRFFGGFRGILKRSPQEKDAENIDKWVKHWLKDYRLTKQDVSQLNTSNPSRTINQNVGDTYKFMSHQLRRSLAYYLIGFELLTYPMLKQQFSHYSLAMTRWYARNASSFAKMQKEIEDERLDQQAEVMSRLYQKIANKERIGGGKAISALANFRKHDISYFTEGDGERLLSKAYWKRMLKSKTTHIHAIAPNMYCTNGSCSMRIAIDLSECVDCGFDLFEFSTYAEQVRVHNMRDLLVAEELGELSPSFAARCIVQIRAAEKLMSDMGTDFEPFEVPSALENILISVEAT